MAERVDAAFETFLALAPARVAGARFAFEEADSGERQRRLAAALVPLAVDAALLGVDGLVAFARALAETAGLEREVALDGLAELERALTQLQVEDASGARVDEAQLRGWAESLRSRGHPPITAPEPNARPFEAVAQALGDEGRSAHAERRPLAADAPEPPPTAEPWTPDLPPDMVSAFLDECGERLDGLGHRLLTLESNAEDPELINSVFRDLHTVKGSSAFAGLKPLNRVAHAAEDLVGELRAGTRTVNRGVVDALLESLDVLRSILDRARRGGALDVDTRAIIARLANPERSGRGSAAARRDGPTAREQLAPKGAAPTLASSEVGAAQATTLRIDFSKVDALMNLVGESVLARGRLASALEVEGNLLRELGGFRQRMSGALQGPPNPATLGSLLADLQRLERVLRDDFDDLEGGLGDLTLAVGQLRDQVMRLRMVPIARLFAKYQRTVRELSFQLGKSIDLEVVGADTELDKVLVERLEDPVLHLVRNAIDHGLEPEAERTSAGKPARGRVRLAAAQRGGQILVTVEDDGRGMDPERLRAKAVDRGLLSEAEAAALGPEGCFALVFLPGFSTAQTVSDVSGRGVGMDVVRDAIQRLKGSVHLDSRLGEGTRVELRLPLTLAITQVLAVRVGNEVVALPVDAVSSAQPAPEALDRVADGWCVRVGEDWVPVLNLGSLLGLSGSAALGDVSQPSLVFVQVGTQRLALQVDQVLGRHDVVMKPLGPLLSAMRCAAGATVVGDRVLLVVDLAEVVALHGAAHAQLAARAGAAEGVPGEPAPQAAPPATRSGRVLVVEDSETVREALRRELTRAGYEVHVAADGRQALRLSREHVFDAVSTDVIMPELDGFELARALRADPRHTRVPIVMLTSQRGRLDALRGADSGADAFLTKPVAPDELLRTLETLISRAVRAR